MGVTQYGFPGAFTPVCWCIFFSPMQSLMESVVKNKNPQAAEASSLGEGQDLIVVKLWEESPSSCCEEICELQEELPCWLTPCEEQCAVTGGVDSGTGPSEISYGPEPGCSQIELAVLCACAVLPHVLGSKAGRGGGAWAGFPCQA